jgi:hypothetical protein
MVQAQEDLPTIKDNDPKVKAMIEWVRQNGGICNAETRIHTITGVRGLYTSKALPNPEEPIVSIPNKLIISPHHVRHQFINADWGSETGPAFS